MISLRPRGNSGRPFPAALAFAAAAALLSACAPTGGSASGSTAAGTGLAADGCTAAPDKPVSLVVGARAGSQRPAVAAGVQDLLSAAVQNQQSVQVFRVDGQPSRALKISPVIKGKNESQRKQEIASAVQQVAQAVSGLGPKKPEADDLTALSEAGKLTGDGGTVVLMDSGLSTTGTISFRDSAMFDADPGELANFLAAKHLLPELKNKAVFLAGLGLTADPQPALDGSLQKKVVALWQAVAAKAGATCTAVLPLPDRRQDTVKTDLPVSKVDVPAAPVFRPCGTTVLRDSGPVGFLPNTARLRDEKGAHDTLQTLVSQLAAWAESDPHREHRDVRLARRQRDAVQAARRNREGAAGQGRYRGRPHHHRRRGPERARPRAGHRPGRDARPGRRRPEPVRGGRALVRLTGFARTAG